MTPNYPQNVYARALVNVNIFSLCRKYVRKCPANKMANSPQYHVSTGNVLVERISISILIGFYYQYLPAISARWQKKTQILNKTNETLQMRIFCFVCLAYTLTFIPLYISVLFFPYHELSLISKPIFFKAWVFYLTLINFFVAICCLSLYVLTILYYSEFSLWTHIQSVSIFWWRLRRPVNWFLFACFSCRVIFLNNLSFTTYYAHGFLQITASKQQWTNG